jgi:glycosyltransferase involved in cell wall biosynthesis
MKKIKVAYFAEILIEEHDGATRTMFQLIRRIMPEQFEFMFFCGVSSGGLNGFECVHVPTLTLPINATYKMAVPALVQKSLKEKIDRFNPDVVHIATPSLLGEFAIKYARQYGLPVISIYHTHFLSYIDYYLKKTPFLIDFVKAKMVIGQRKFYNQCDVVYVPAESIAAELAEIGIDNSRLKIWKRGIDTGLFSPGKKDKYRMQQITGNNNPVILFASRLVWEKNLETLFNIYDVLKGKHQPFNLVIAGDGTARKACETRMPDAVFLGKIPHEQLSVLYASADVFVFPSVSETYGNVVLEAMASGLPCVIADGGGSKDFITQGINGFKCAPYTAACYVEKIEQLIHNPPLHREMVSKGLQYSSAFGWEQLAGVYFDDLQLLAGYQTYSLA